jgi:hypothetical protein
VPRSRLMHKLSGHGMLDSVHTDVQRGHYGFDCEVEPPRRRHDLRENTGSNITATDLLRFRFRPK